MIRAEFEFVSVMSDPFSPTRTEMFICLNPCLTLFAMESTRWVFIWVQVSCSQSGPGNINAPSLTVNSFCLTQL